MTQEDRELLDLMRREWAAHAGDEGDTLAYRLRAGVGRYAHIELDARHVAHCGRRALALQRALEHCD